MRIAVLASGSTGNASIIENDEGQSLLIDAGISARKIRQGISSLGVNEDSLCGIILTHEHGDHIRGCGPLVRQTGIPVYCTELTWKYARHQIGEIGALNFVIPGQELMVSSFRIKPFSIPHDAQDPIGLTIEADSQKIGIATDVGYPTKLVRDRLRNCHAIILEFNYNRDMLISGPYTWPMKQRIMSRNGHMSNDDACDLLSEVASPRLQHLVLAHLSESNNLPELALLSVRQLFSKLGLNSINVVAGDPKTSTEWLELKIQYELN